MMTNTRPRWTDTIGLCASYGQLWIVYPTEPPKLLASCEYHPLARDWSEVEITLAMPPVLDRNGGLYRIQAGALSMVVLAPGAVSYAAHRTLFSISNMSITESPGLCDTFQDEGPLIYKLSVVPDFQGTSAKAWATVWRERIRRWFRRRILVLKRAFQ